MTVEEIVEQLEARSDKVKGFLDSDWDWNDAYRDGYRAALDDVTKLSRGEALEDPEPAEVG